MVFACLCATLCIYLCMRRKLAAPPNYGPTYAEKQGPPEDRWLGHLAPEAKPEGFWWHGATSEVPTELIPTGTVARYPSVMTSPLVFSDVAEHFQSPPEAPFSVSSPLPLNAAIHIN